MRRERGFTLIEVLVASAIWVVLTGAMLYATQGLFAGARGIAAARAEYLTATRLLEHWDAEASSALAIFVPPLDVLGNGNGDGHEFDFYTRDAAHFGHFWAYRWDRATQTIQRYTYALPGGAAVAIDPPATGVSGMRAVRKLASAVGQPFLNGYPPKDVAVNYGYPGVDGGNALTDVILTNRRGTFELELLPGTMASGFAVVVGTYTPPPLAAGPSQTDGPAPAPTSPPATAPPSGAPPTAPAAPSQSSLPASPVPSAAPTTNALPTAEPTVAVTTPPPTGATAQPAALRTVLTDVCVPNQRQDGGGCVDTPKWLCQQANGAGSWTTIDTWLDSEHQWNDPPASWCS